MNQNPGRIGSYELTSHMSMVSWLVLFHLYRVWRQATALTPLLHNLTEIMVIHTVAVKKPAWVKKNSPSEEMDRRGFTAPPHPSSRPRQARHIAAPPAPSSYPHPAARVPRH